MALVPSCVQAPTVSVVDQKTALERQAAGEYPTLDSELQQAVLVPHPEPFARQDIGRASGKGSLGPLTELVARAESDADAIDGLLLEQCVGEELSGYLVPRAESCRKGTDTAELARLVGRANLHRRQLWQMIASERGATVAEAQRRWASVHREQVVCGGLLQQRDSSWGPKPCEEP